MLTLTKFTCENQASGCVTDNKKPRFSFSVSSDKNSVSLANVELTVNGWVVNSLEQVGIQYEGAALKPFTEYSAHIKITSNVGETVTGNLTFRTGRLETPWHAQWITDGDYVFKEKKVSPIPMTFKRTFTLNKEVEKVTIYGTALGMYELSLNGEKVGIDYFAPGFTSYKNNLQYQVYDITNQINEQNELVVVVAGGWAVGSFGIARKNRISGKRQALLLEIRITYEDGTEETIGTDDRWQVTLDGPYLAADIYDGEVYDATIANESMEWRKVSYEQLKISPNIKANYGEPVRAHEQMRPVSCVSKEDSLIYDFGQNFAGVIQLTINGRKGQKIIVKHSEILNTDGSLNTTFLRSARAEVNYTCREGKQIYSPRFTYMGFRYLSITGIEAECIDVSALALYSDIKQIGDFSCSDEMINQLQNNIVWSSKSNFVDIPTDCPQRDERMGWTGDIAIFAPTANFNFDMSRFIEKWLYDMEAEQLPTGGIPNVIPAQGFGFPETMPTMAVDFWGDASVLVPWADYWARGDQGILAHFYPMMKKYVNACKFWAGFLSVGKHRYIWHTHHMLHFGDWVAPDLPKMSQWQKRSRWTATASLKNTSGILAQIAGILGEKADQQKYAEISRKTAEAYRAVFTDGQGLLHQEFQTGYVLPIQFEMFPEKEKQQAVRHLVRLIKQEEYRIGTGFPGTPYLLFALADNGYADVAYKMLQNTECPSWMHQIKMGATTIWERWDGLDKNGLCPIGDDGTDIMISYNHYASGAVGDFLYRRIAGLEALEPGYKCFKLAPVLGGDITSCEVSLISPYGKIKSKWQVIDNNFEIYFEVPVSTNCHLILPDGTETFVASGIHNYQCNINNLGLTNKKAVSLE